MRKNDRILGGLVVMLILAFLPWGRIYAQDTIPGLALPQRTLLQAVEAREMHRFMRPIAVHDSLPPGFLHAAANVIEDDSHSLVAFWQKLNELSGPVRIVHIGDSHVRGHLYPLVTRRGLEADFGAEAVFPDTISYRTSGLARETGHAGVVYHIMGINGATCATFSTEQKIKEIADLHPDLVIVSFGTNEAHSRRYQVQDHKYQISHLISMLEDACPGANFLLTTPPGAYTGRRRSRIVNPRTVTVARTIREYAQEHHLAVWNLYDIVGGKTDACRNWTKHRMIRADGIHFTPEGYRLQGNLLHQALIKAFNDYVATGFDQTDGHSDV